jgi:hypothetical protein
MLTVFKLFCHNFRLQALVCTCSCAGSTAGDANCMQELGAPVYPPLDMTTSGAL